VFAADKPGPAATSAFLKPSTSTNGMWIWSDGGMIYNGVNSTITYRTNVRAADPKMFLQCELLTAYYNTNSTRIEAIVAEEKVMILSDGRQILGDRAIYTSSNDVVAITGLPVIMADDRATLLGTQFVFDRKAGNFYSVGPVTTIFETSGDLLPLDPLGANPGGNRPATTAPGAPVSPGKK
jgi:lipopolysaccharide export system protein LptA